MKVVELYRYPVKSLRGHPVPRADIETMGMAGDRRWMVVDKGGQFLTIRQIPAMTTVDVEHRDASIVLKHDLHGSLVVEVPGPDAALRPVKIWKDSVVARQADPAAGDYLSGILGRPVDLVHFDDPKNRPVDPEFAQPGDYVGFADGFPLLVTTTGSLNHLNGHLARPVEMARFRPNIVLDAQGEWPEDSWKAIRIGSVELRIAKPCARCVITTRDPLSGEQPDPREPLQTLGKLHRSAKGGIIFGQNAIPNNAGTISIGDAVEVIEAGVSNLR
ncbi:MOSC domain-containing protein [Mesorhizobium sp. B2-3-4]|uniref:MOSC domain-containing protein n=1 Tax=Mesorhizobium sp. B2-3-4 TaxID=2589959 RepID=UPI00112A2AF1|nr:MOSC domain-containing protein [Mesorhizobium sp. B2-3-4]TPM27487.1 MOSC domain-containing protein [Mesorhizobium sp. B2-3-4]